MFGEKILEYWDDILQDLAKVVATFFCGYSLCVPRSAMSLIEFVFAGKIHESFCLSAE